MAIALSSGTTPVFKRGTGTTVASTAFSPPSGSVIIAAIANESDDTLATSVTDSLGTHLTWTKIASYADATDTFGVEFWWAAVTTAPGSMTVSVTYSGSKTAYLQPLVFTGAAPVQSGNASTSGRSAVTGLLSQAVVSTAAGSVAAFVAYNNTGAPTPGTNQTITFGGTSSFNASENTWTQLLTTPAGASGSTITLNITAPTSTVWAALTVEILAASAASPLIHPGRVISQAATRASTY